MGGTQDSIVSSKKVDTSDDTNCLDVFPTWFAYERAPQAVAPYKKISLMYILYIESLVVIGIRDLLLRIG